MRREQPADPQMGLGAQFLRDQRIGGLLDAVVDELVGACPSARPAPDGRAVPQSRMDLLLRCPENDRKRRDLGDVAEAGQLLQRLLRLGRQAGQLPDHEVHHVVGVALGVNAIEIPGPARAVMIEGEQPLFGERRKKLNGEKRIAAGLLVHQLAPAARRAPARSEEHPQSTAPGLRGRAAQD